MRCRKWYERTILSGRQSTGGFASPLSVLSMAFKPGMLHLGRASAFGFGLLQPVGMKITRHIFMLAMTGSGKTTALITIASSWYGSMYIVDVKAQIVDALYKNDWRTWCVFDPENISKAPSIAINVFDCIKEAIQRDGDNAAVLWAMRIAEAIIVTPTGSKSVYFYDVSRQFLASLIVHVLTQYPQDYHHLPFIRDLIIKGQYFCDGSDEVIESEEAHELLLYAMSHNSAYDGFVTAGAAALISASGETGGNVRSTLQDQTKFLSLPNVRKSMMHSDISLSELKTRHDVVLAFVAPIYSIREELSRINRLLTNMIAYTFESVPNALKQGQCLTVLDELPSQLHNPVIEVKLAVARSFGQVFLGVSQNIELMKRHYPNSWKSFVGEADCVFHMGCNHPDNAEFLSKLLGRKTLIETDKHTGRKTRRDVAVRDPEQLSRMLDPNSERLIVTRAGGRALLLRNDPYFKALPVWRYSPDPEHGDSFWRSLLRKAVGQ